MGNTAKTALTCALLTTALGTGCFFGGKSSGDVATRVSRPGFHLPVPTKDEVVLVDGRAITIGGFIGLRSVLPQASVETTYSIAVAALALQNDAEKSGFELSAASAVTVARYGMDGLALSAAEPALREYFRATPPGQALPAPGTVKTQVDQLLARSVIQRNPQVLAEIH